MSWSDWDTSSGCFEDHIEDSSSDDWSSWSSIHEGINNKHLRLKLHTMHLLSASDKKNNKLINLCINTIGESVYNGIDNLLNLIIYNAQYNELQQIYKIMKDIKLGHDEKKENKTDNDEYNIINKSPFCMLAPECVANICSNLTRKDIKSLKLVCYDIGVVCLEHMMRYSVGICNTNKFINLSPFHVNTQFDRISKLMTYNVYHQSTALNLLTYEWERIYNIPIKYQILYHQNMLLMGHNIDDKPIQSIKRKQRCYVLFDTRNMVTISDEINKPKLLTECSDTNMLINTHKLVIFLQYFDINKQTLFTIQTILLKNKSITAQKILNYVKHEFISTCNEQLEWNKKLMFHIETNDSQLTLWNNNKKIELNEVISKHSHSKSKITTTLTLQLEKVPFTEIEKYELSGISFCDNAALFHQKLKSIKRIKFYYLHSESILRSRINELSSDCDTLIKNVLNNNRLQQDDFTNYGFIRRQISVAFNGVISPNDIELYHKTYSDYKGIFMKLPWDKETDDNIDSVFFDFVASKQPKLSANKPIITYYVKIFKPDQAILPLIGILHPKDTFAEISTSLTFEYQNEFIFDETFIAQIMNEISKPVYSGMFDEILKLHHNNNNNDILYGLYDGRKYLLFDEKYYSKHKNSKAIHTLYLIMYRNPFKKISPNHVLNTIPITILFVFNHGFYKKTVNIKAMIKRHLIKIGLILWINVSDTVEQIIKRNELRDDRYKSINNIYIHNHATNAQQVELISASTYQPKTNDVLILEVFHRIHLSEIQSIYDNEI